MGETMWTMAKVDLGDLTISLAELDNDTLLKFVALLDERVAEWDFTVKLRDYFNGMDYSEVES